MKYLLLSDVHANYPALRAVLSDTPPYDKILYLGDILGIYGYPNKTVTNLREKSSHIIRGNHDYAVIEQKRGHVNDGKLSKYEYQYTWNKLTSGQISWIKSLSSYEQIDDSTIIAHAKPFPEESCGYEKGNSGIFKRDWPQLASTVSDDVDFVFLGHTHRQGELNCEKFGHNVHIVNPGSVGQPMGNAEYAVIDTETNETSLHKISYDTNELKEHLSTVFPENGGKTNTLKSAYGMY